MLWDLEGSLFDGSLRCNALFAGVVRHDIADKESKERMRPTRDDEVLARDICTADLQAKLVALRNKKIQNQKRYAVSSGLCLACSDSQSP